MNTIDQKQFREFLTKSGIDVADPSSPIGRQLTYPKLASRTIVVHFAESDSPAYIHQVCTSILLVAETWLLLPRHGTAAKLGLIEGGPDVAAISFGSSDLTQLTNYLCTRPMTLGAVSTDLYVVASSGNILVTWDHHASDDGLDIQLRRVSDSNLLLVSLNELGAELEVFFTDS